MKVQKTAFTLIEIMLVVAIIGVLAAMVVPKLTGRLTKAKISVTRADVKTNIPLALDLYELDMGEFPKDLSYLRENRDNNEEWAGSYLKSEPLDGWGRAYYYVCPGERNRDGYDLYSAGPDGEPRNDDDIVNWEK